MLWQITNLQQWGCATYLNGTSLVHRLAEQYTSLSTAGETVITNVTIETFGEASIRSLCACFPCKLCIVAYTHAHLGRLHVFACSSMGFDETGAWIRTSNPHSYTYSSHRRIINSMHCRLVGVCRVQQQCHQGADKCSNSSSGWLHHSTVCPSTASSCLRSCFSSVSCQHRRGGQEASVHPCLRRTDSRCCSCSGRACTGAVPCVQLPCIRLRPKLW